ncbi:DUF881 domain-containing protein [Microlunatus speluncae]|uniref:DUF881 domain-containing protein n=1 Tax=Microlunatus speluncae TaxID=2594267 RepID=UPI001FEB4EB3|nr:DUF881 domain-containing protein [Microlunatus speluncae]
MPEQKEQKVSALRRLGRAMTRPGKAQVIAAVMLFLVGLGAVMQIRANSAEDAYRNARREDLIQLLDGLAAESERLEDEIAELDRTRSELQSGANTSRVAREQLEQRLEVTSILAGTVPAQGPGIRMTIEDPLNKIDGDILLSAVEELRDAGAEVIEINDSVRVVASTWFGGAGDQLVADGKPVTRPITISVIGDSHSLEEAARFRGGIVSEITGPRIGGEVDIDQLDRLVINSLHHAEPNQYARPASGPPTPR